MSDDFQAPDHFTVDAIGEPGHRLFLVQVAEGDKMLTLKVEKTQVAALAVYLAQALDGLGRPGHLPENLELRSPSEPAWAVGSMAVTYDDERDRLVLIFEDMGEPEESSVEQTRMTVLITREQAAAIAIRGTALVEAGRPPCPLCGYPIESAAESLGGSSSESSGHACPRTNGNRPPTL